VIISPNTMRGPIASFSYAGRCRAMSAAAAGLVARGSVPFSWSSTFSRSMMGVEATAALAEDAGGGADAGGANG
jgi:hypothetical protein